MDEKRITLLAPARDINVAKAAIQAGADAVYIGSPRFGAREKAANSLEDIAALVRYAQPYGVQVLVTLNTLLTDEERPSAVEMAWSLYHIGVDALIIQDLSLLNENLPPIRLHASTQCDNRTPEQILHLQSLGFKRVVLARELSIDEIKNISTILQRSGLPAQRSASDSGLPASAVLQPQAVYRNHDSAFLRSLHAERRVLVDILFKDTPTGFELTIADKTATFDYPHEVANNPERAINTIRTQLAKLGDTPYEARNIDINLTQPYFIPIATLNQWRRQLTQNNPS